MDVGDRVTFDLSLRHVGSLPSPALPSYNDSHGTPGLARFQGIGTVLERYESRPRLSPGISLSGRRGDWPQLHGWCAVDPALTCDTALKTVSRRWSKATFLGALCAVVLASSPLFAADLHDEDEVEAAFLYRFAGYVDWPPEASRARTSRSRCSDPTTSIRSCSGSCRIIH